MVNSNNTSVNNFYAGKSIFITGATGFIGKVLVEKLLYSCVDINKIYLLVRSKENISSEQRLQEITNKQLFERIKKTNPQILEKLVAISGDLTENNLGISSDDEKLIIDKVSVVFHSAANVRFNQNLAEAVENIFEATKRVLSLCHRMKNLKSFVYMSTAFIKPYHPNLDEVVYPSPVGVKELQTFISQGGMDDEKKLAEFLRGRPNTYTFTKAVTENYVATSHGTIPTTIIRPSIVLAAASEPIPGWIDCWSVATGVVATTFLGFCRVFVGESSNIIDFIPVDYVTNLSIVAAANKSQNDLEIYNSCTTSCNPLSIEDLYKAIKGFAINNGYNDVPVFTIVTKDGVRQKFASFLLEKLPAMVADWWLSFKGEKPRYVKLQSRVSVNREHIKFFTSRSFNMSAEKTIALSRSLSEEDRTLFPFNPQLVNWKQYLPVYCHGIKRFLLRK